MNRCKYIIGIALLTFVAMPLFAQVSNDNEDEVNKVDTRFSAHDFIPGQVLVKFKDANRLTVRRAQGRFASTSVSKVTDVLQKYGTDEMEQLLPNEKPNRTLRRAKAYNGETIQEHDLSQLYCLKLSENHQHETMQMVEELKTLDEVEFAEPNYRVYMMADTHIADDYSGNPMESQQWYLDAYGVKELWNKPVINKERPIIAILDTGVDLTHPDLKDNLWTNTAEAYGTKDNDNDGNGFKNDVHGYDFVNNTGDIRDNNMHGTHVAGIAAAANNGIGIIGANPQALIMPITVLQSDGSGDIATIIKGIDYATANGAKILNLSLGTYSNSRAFREALAEAYHSAVIIAAAGNAGMCLNHVHGSIPSLPCFPAAYSFVLGIQATEKGGDVADFSNYDDDGPTFSTRSTFLDPDGFNYELMAPGKKMLSTIPGGNYKELNGTSMSAPLVSGAVSALMMVKQYETQEILWGDLLHSNNIMEAYNIDKRPAELDIMKVILRDRKELAEETEDDYSGDNEMDAGETISIYPVIRTTFGKASNIRLLLEVDENEDPGIVKIVTKEADFGIRLDAYGKGVSLNPLQLEVPNSISDSRHIQMNIVARCDESSQTFSYPFTLVVRNMVKLNGMLKEDMTLNSGHTYLVNGTLGISNGVTLTVEPGARVEFVRNACLTSFGRLIANGTSEKPIIFTGHLGGGSWLGIYMDQNANDEISFCQIEECDGSDMVRPTPYFKNCVLRNVRNYGGDGEFNLVEWSNRSVRGKYNNIINNSITEDYRELEYCNFFNNEGLSVSTYTPTIIQVSNPPYLGSSREDLVRENIFLGDWTSLDLHNMRTVPYQEAHGVVWKVLVNEKDTQDEFDDVAPLGVGKHKFEIFFSRPMNKEAVPTVSFGVRDPFTQQIVAEDGSWNTEGTIYTVYKTITGKTNSNGLNRINISGAKDGDFFDCPQEKTRFNFIIQAAGAMSTGFIAEAGLGKVTLKWNNDNNNFDDAMGFNIYRYMYVLKDSLDRWGYKTGKKILVPDTVRINKEMVDIETTSFIDYDVKPGETYYYYYNVLSTDLQEYDVSNVIAATPLTSVPGDANGSTIVDIADVVATVNYILRKNPQPFIFEAADLNADNVIDILDVMGIVRCILNPGASAAAMDNSSVIYTVEDGTLYVENSMPLGGVQVQFTLSEKGKMNGEQFATTAELKGFEQSSAWLSDNDYLFLAYSMNGKTLVPGKHALLYIGDADITSLRLCDVLGRNVNVENGRTTGIDRMGKHVMNVEGVYDLQGRKLSPLNSDNSTLKKGVYIINGQKVVK